LTADCGPDHPVRVRLDHPRPYSHRVRRPGGSQRIIWSARRHGADLSATLMHCRAPDAQPRLPAAAAAAAGGVRESAGCAAAAVGDEGVLGAISARWQRCAWVATGAPVSRTLRPFDRAECDGSASHDRQSRIEELRRDLLTRQAQTNRYDRRTGRREAQPAAH
jgi:hypothetical protein